MELESFVVAAVFLLIVTSVTVALSKRFGLGSVIGLLVAGVIVGPHSARTGSYALVRPVPEGGEERRPD